MRIDTPEFKSWLRARPRPDKVKAYLETGGSRTVKVRPRRGVQYWKEVLDALSAYQVMRVELLDEEGNVLRHMTTEAEEEPPDPEEVAQAAFAAHVATPVEASATRDTRLVEFARLLNTAYTTGARLQKESNEHAFNKLVELTNIAFQRLDSLERAYNRVFKNRIRKDLDGDEEVDEGGVRQVIETMVAQRVMQQMGLPDAAAVANGAVKETAEKED